MTTVVLRRKIVRVAHKHIYMRRFHTTVIATDAPRGRVRVTGRVTVTVRVAVTVTVRFTVRVMVRAIQYSY